MGFFFLSVLLLTTSVSGLSSVTSFGGLVSSFCFFRVNKTAFLRLTPAGDLAGEPEFEFWIDFTGVLLIPLSSRFFFFEGGPG